MRGFRPPQFLPCQNFGCQNDILKRDTAAAGKANVMSTELVVVEII